MKALYIFVTTDRPDQYLNSIVRCIEEGTKKIIFVQVEDSQTEQVKLNLLRTNVYNLIQNLSIGCYKYYIGDRKDTVVSLDTVYNPDEFSRLKAKYSFCLSDNIDWKVERIQYLDLRQYISLLKKNKDLIIDVTAVSKVYIGDIFACSLLENINSLYTFELLVKPDFDKPWKTLIHELEDSKKYNYTNLVSTPIFKESTKSVLIRTTPLLVSIFGTVLFIGLTLAAISILGFSSVFAQAMSTVGTVLGIISFFLIYFPIRT
ncbi:MULTISPECIES: hypothetical protein [Nostoc]|uniref:Uncharacterized protein n=2 Tax=Nostoc TaxID=1177 RepID=A0ABR8IBX5_9NOSO|nr:MULTISPECIES: hypothetical protein [Nostoc]MBD2564239.1 hypothetical protein [Nostoc linckia FACHB-391]MBD2648055.1 hypothetical protein [Nostoc foliaceum FACHB-393]